jgi:5-methylcytosine-specific restriction protein A
VKAGAKSGLKVLPGRVLAEAGRAVGAGGEVGPHGGALCRWCRMEILAKRRRTFCSDFCVHQWRLRSDPGYLRDQVFARDRGVCALCETDTVAAYAELKRSRGRAREEALEVWGMKSVGARRSLWDADHMRPVAEGGGECDLENLRTLCLPCHREVTADLRRRLRGAVRAVDS